MRNFYDYGIMKFNFSKSRNGGCLFKLVKLAILVVLILIVIAYFSITYIADYALKTITSGTGIESGVGSISMSLTKQQLDVKNFFLTNPPNYKKCNAISFKNAFVDTDISPMKFLKDKILVVDEIRIDGLFLNLDLRTGSGLSALLTSPKSNITEISEILQKSLGVDSSVAEEEPSSEPAQETQAGDSEPMRFIIKRIVFDDGTVSGAFNNKGFEFPLPSFTIENIGVRENGLTGGELAVKLTGIIGTRVTVDAVKHITKESVNITEGAAKDGVDATRDVGKDISNAIKSIFN